MIIKHIRSFGTLVTASRIQKGAILKLEGVYVEVLGSKTGFGSNHQLEFRGLGTETKAKFSIKAYDNVELIDTEFIVEVDRIGTETIITTNDLHERIEVPMSLIDESEKQRIKTGTKLGILMDDGQFVRIKVKNNIPSWMTK